MQHPPINLMSDTVTRPTPAMLQAMMTAEVGDDVFGEDPTVNALQDKMAEMFGKEAALFCPSGTMTNQIAIKTHTQPLDEVICEEKSHIYQYETGGFAFNSGVSIRLLQGEHGKLQAQQIADAVKPVYDWLPISKLVVLENTGNKAGGSYYTVEEIEPIREVCTKHQLKLHLDGARLFNALVETGESTQAIGALFDSISICLSKGLGAPVGSVLIGDADFIRQARRYRKVMGGGMRQAGFLAAACLYALENNIDRLKEDNDKAKRIAAQLSQLDYVENIRPVHTNILIFDVKAPWTAHSFLERLKQANILAVAFGPQTVRFVTHLEVTEEMVEKVIGLLKTL
jgi:threonine aldolase